MCEKGSREIKEVKKSKITFLTSQFLQVHLIKMIYVEACLLFYIIFCHICILCSYYSKNTNTFLHSCLQKTRIDILHNSEQAAMIPYFASLP